VKLSSAPRLIGATAALLLALTGCTAVTTPDATPEPVAATDASTLTISDAWVKSAPDGMSAAFGMLMNDSDHEVNIVSATSSASEMVELHETVESESGTMVMRPKEGGFVIPAGGMIELAPGSNHIMLMGLTAPILAGDDVDFTLTLSDGSTFDFTAPGKDFTGANENYVGTMPGMGSGN